MTRAMEVGDGLRLERERPLLAAAGARDAGGGR